MTGATNGTHAQESDGHGATSARPSATGDTGSLSGSAHVGAVRADVGAVVRLRPVQLPSAPATETAVLLGMLERASSDPTIDIERMERMYALYERAAARSAKSAYIDALMKAKGELPRIIKTGAASYEDKKTGEKKEAFKYAKWEEVCVQIEPVLARHGLVLTFSSDQSAADRISVTGILSHRDGHSERAQIALGCDASGGKNNAQGWGSSLQYGKRYSAFALLNLVGQDDKDTDAATPPPAAITDEQAATLREWIEATNSDEAVFLKHFKASSIATFPASEFNRAVTAFQKKAGRK